MTPDAASLARITTHIDRPFTSLNMDGARQSTHPRRELMQVVASASALSLVGPLTWRRLQMLRNSCPQDLIQHCFHDLAQLALAR